MALAVGAGVTCLEVPGTALAVWPPLESFTSADMALPENWPSDEFYGYTAASRPNDRFSGQWVFYSFIPDRSPGAPPPRPEEMAAGMSVDLAWRHTIGDDRVLIAVLDSGIKWADVNINGVDLSLGLAIKAFLNRGELVNNPPLNTDMSPCGGTGTLAGFDCNGDGIFDVRDYADTPTLQPAATADNPLGDANRNGILDPSDLIINFSDGVDDDGNGYTDDISGWDFFKNDNDPFDDTQYLHGTQEASWSSARTNDGEGDAGVCPLCRFIPLRAGDSFVADSQDYAKAVVYAVDIGANVVQEALGTIDFSPYAQQAMDYAWDNDVVVIGSMADENARHHNFPATANHVVPVHAIALQSLSEDATSATSFLAFNNCTNFGAQNFLSVSGLGCSSEGAGRQAGISGLTYSMALQVNLDPPLTASEAMQLAMMTADDIDVPESREADSIFKFSQPGFDQRFGYGRVNANTSVEWVKQGKIPPRVDITSPIWFEILYRDKVDLVPIEGSISAPRAGSYDYVVEWAPGVQPLDDAFTTITEMSNVPGTQVTGGSEPLAMLDVDSIDTTHERDPDSPDGENDFAITVRVRVVAHYGDPVGDVPGELRRSYHVYEDPDLVDGFPINMGASLESSPKLADLDGDGIRDLIQATGEGSLHAYSLASGRPEMLPGFPFKSKKLDGLDGDASRTSYLDGPAYRNGVIDTEITREAFGGTPAVWDMDGDDRPEIVITTLSGTIYVLNADGTVRNGWPVRLPDIPSCPLDRDHTGELCMGTETGGTVDITKGMTRGAFGAPVLEDMDGDGQFEIIQAAFDGFVHIYKLDGSLLPNWPVRVHFTRAGSNEFNRILTTPAVADFNDDGTPDILVGSNEKLGSGSGAGAFYVIDGRGMAAGDPPYLPNWPISMVSFNLFPVVAEGATVSPATADFTGDGLPHGVMHGNASAPLILPGDPGAQNTLGATPANALPDRVDQDTGEAAKGLAPTSRFGADSKAITPDTMFPLFSQPSIGDLNQDGTPDITTSGGSLSLAQNLLSSISLGDRAQFLLSMWDGKSGRMLPGSPFPLNEFTFFNNPSIVDLTGDGYPEVVTSTGGYYVYAADACGRLAEGFPKFTGQWVISSTAVGDLTGDNSLELVVGSRSGFLYAWKTNATTDSVIAWESYHHDNRNTGNYEVPLDQGVLIGEQGPLPVDEDGHCIAPDSTSGDDGGCGCRVGSTSQAKLGWIGGLLVGFGLFGMRRLRRRRD